jgi:ADP-ribosyl-[dinitrogen reductase] hydrolase
MLAGAKYGLERIPERWLARLNALITEEIRSQAKKLTLIKE